MPLSSENPDLAERFARLTAILEDASGIAAQGQATALSPVTNLRLCRRLRSLVVEAEGELARIEAFARDGA